MTSWTSLHQWLYDKKSILSDEQHLLSRYMGAEGSFEAYKNAVKNGTNIHDLESAVRKYQAAVTQLGFSDEYITEISEGVYQIVFRPTNKKIHISDADCPSLVISTTDENGIAVSHNLPSMNLPVWAMGQDGSAGLTSALAAGIDQATNEIREQAGRLSGVRDLKKLANSLKYYTNKAVTGVTHNNPAITTKSQSDAYRKAVQIGDIGELRAEAIAAMSGQTLTSFYNRSLYNANKGKMYMSGAPKSERQFHQWLEEIRNGSRNYTTVKELGDYIHRRFPWVYNNIWKGQLENMYEAVYNIGQHQGTRKEGSPGIISLWDVDTPFASMAPAASNKPGKALRAYQKRASGAHGKSGTNYTMTKSQSKFYKKGEEYPMYYMGTVTDDDIFAAAQELGLPMDALKGTMADSSVYAHSILKDFQMEVHHAQKVSAGEVRHKLRAFAKDKLADSLTKRGITDIDKIEDEVTKYLADPKHTGTLEKEIRSIVAKELGLKVGPESGDNVFVNQGSKPIYDSLSGKYLVDVVEKLTNPTFTTRSGATGDYRSVTSVMNDKLLALAFKKHGYSEQQIFKDWKGSGYKDIMSALNDENWKEKTGGLKMTVGVGGSEIEAKNIWSYLDRVYNYIASEMLGGNDPMSAKNGNQAVVKKLTEGVPFLKGALEYDSETGRIIMNNEAIRKNIGNPKITGGKKGSAFGALRQLVDFAQGAGIYESGEYFKDLGDGKFELAKPLVMGSEIGVFSGVRYQGVGDESDSRMKLDRRGLLSMQETLGRMRLRHPDRLKEIEPMEKMVAGYQAQFDEMNKEYMIYQKSLDHLSKTFNGNVSDVRADLLEHGLLITPDKLAGLSTDIGYDNDKIFSEDGKELAVARIKQLAEARYQELLAQYGKAVLESGPNPIYSAKDLQIGLDTGDRRFLYTDQFGTHAGGIMMLSAMGALEKSESFDPETGLARAFSYTSDDITKANNSIIRAYLEFMNADRSDYAAAVRAGYGASGGIQDIRSAILNGSIYEKYSKIVMPEGGYLLQHAMNSNSAEILKKKAEEMRAKGREVSDEFIGAKYMMHPEDAKAILNAFEIVDDQKVYQHSDEELRKRYGELYKISKKDLSKKGRDQLINGIIDAFTLENDNFKGQLDNSNMFWRSPTLKMYDDILGGGLLLSNSLVSRGNLLADPDMVAAFKGDFDGDRIAVFNALQQGDLATASKVMNEYFGALSKAQKQARKTPSNEINMKEIDKILSIADQLGLASAANAGYKGSGVYGNLLFGLAGGLQDAGLGFATASSNNVGGALSSHMALNLAGALYQEGINIKNVKTKGKKGHNSEEDLNKLMSMATSATTWGSLDAMLTMLSHMESLDMSGKTGLFKDNVMANLGMGFGDMTDKEWEYYADMAKKAANDDELKKYKKQLLAEAATFENKSAKNFSKELAAYIITSKHEGGLNYYLGKNGSSISDIIQHMYGFIGGHDANPELVTSRAYDNSTDEITKKRLEEWGQHIRQKHESMAKRENVSFQEWMTDPSNTWAARRLEFIASEKGGRDMWANPHQVNDYLFGPYTDKKGRVPDSLQKPFADYRQALLDGKMLEEINIPSDEIATFKENTVSTMRGSLIHTYMEIFGNALKEVKVSPDELTKDMMHDPAFRGATEDFAKVLKGLGYSQLEASFELNNAELRARGLQNMLANNLFTTTTTKKGKIKTQKTGDVLGTELVLPGQIGAFKTTGVADVIMSQIDEDGKRILRVGDYKNTANGRLSINDLMQTAQYLDFLRTWKEDIIASGKTDAESYFKSSGSPFVKRILDSIQYQSEKEANPEQFKKDQMAQYYKLFEDVRLADRFAGSVFATSGASGAVRQYDFDLENMALRGALNMAHAGRMITPDIQEYLLSTAPRVKYEGTVKLGDAEAFNKYLTQLDKQLSKENEIALLRDHMLKQTEAERAVTQQTIDQREKELETLKEGTETLRKNVSIAGQTYTGYDKDRAKTDVFYEYNEAERKLREDNAKYLANAQTLALEEEKRAQEKDLLKEYGDTMKRQWSAKGELRKVDRELSVRDRLSEEEVALIEKEKEELEKFIESLGQAAEQIRVYFKGTETSAGVGTTEGKKAFDELLGSLKLSELKDQRAERLATESDEAYKIRTEQADKSTVYNAYRTRDNARYKIWETDQRLQTETDDLTKEFLEIQKQSLQEMLVLAEDELTRLRDSHTDKGTGKMNDYWSKIYGDMSYRSALELQAKEAAFAAKKGAANAMGGGGFFGGIDSQLSMYFKRMMGGGIIMRLLGKFRQEVNKIIQQAKELDKVMTNVRIVTNGTASETRNLMHQYSELGKSLGATTREVAQAGIEWMRQGYSAAETTNLITASLYLSKLGMIDSTQATKNLTSALKGFKLEAAEAMSVVDKLTAIDLKAATSAGDIAEGLAQFANLGSLSGVDIDQAAAYVATIADVTQMSGSSAGQALKTIISRYGNVKAGAYNKLNIESESGDTDEKLNDVEKVLNKIGISIRDTNLQFKDFDEVLAEIADKWGTLDNVSKKAIANAFAGKHALCSNL